MLCGGETLGVCWGCWRPQPQGAEWRYFYVLFKLRQQQALFFLSSHQGKTRKECLKGSINSMQPQVQSLCTLCTKLQQYHLNVQCKLCDISCAYHTASSMTNHLCIQSAACKIVGCCKSLSLVPKSTKRGV